MARELVAPPAQLGGPAPRRAAGGAGATTSRACPNFLTVSNQINLFQLGIEKAIVVLIMTFVIISGEIDLSVASMMGLSAAVTAALFESGVPMPAGDPGGARRRRGIRSAQRLLRRGRGTELAGGDAGGLRRVSRSGATARRRTVRSAGSRSGSPDLGQQVCRAVDALDSDLRRAGGRRHRGPAFQRVRAAHLRHRQQRPGRAVLRRLGRADEDDHLH